MLLTDTWGHIPPSIHDCYTQQDGPGDLRLTTRRKEGSANVQSEWGDNRLHHGGIRAKAANYGW